MEWEGTATVRDVRNWRRICSFGKKHMQCASISPNGRRALTGNSMGQLTWCDAGNGRRLAVVSCHRHAVSAPGFSPDGTAAASVAGDGTLALWDVSKFYCIVKFKGHMLGTHSVAISSDHRRLATGGGSGREAVKLWDLVTCREMLTLAGDGSVFNSVAFSPDGNWLVARSSVESRLHLWRAPPWAEIEAAVERGQAKAAPQPCAIADRHGTSLPDLISLGKHSQSFHTNASRYRRRASGSDVAPWNCIELGACLVLYFPG